MPQEAEAGRRLARDMRRIREAHNLTVGDLHDETKIPLGLIEAFEDTALFDHPQFNRVYLRSFVRTYAQVVGIDADIAMEALEEALSDRYVGSLAVEYLGEEPVVEESPPAADEEVAEGRRPGTEESPDGDTADKPPAEAAGPTHEPEVESREKEAPGEEAEAEGERREPPEEVGPKPEEMDAAETPSAGTGDMSEDVSTEEVGPPPRKKKGKQATEEPPEDADEEGGPPMVSTTAEAAAGYEAVASEEAESDEDWTVQSPPSGNRAERQAAPSGGGLDRRWIIGGVIVLVVAVVVWILVGVLGGDRDQEAQPVAAADTVQTEETPETTRPAQEAIDVPALGDTMDVHIVAARGKLDPIRVTVDEDLRRPYWVEEGDSMLFQPTNRIVVEELLENVDLKIEGIEYPTDRRDPQGRVVITRDSVQAYFASVQGSQ